ncbi:unnamed protein product [Wickerhamomyces anomalus]
MITVDPRPPAFKNAAHEISVVLLIMFAQLLNQAGTTQTLPMMNLLEKSFPNITPNDKVWFMAAFPLTSGAFILISGKFGDLYGLKKILLIGISWSLIWTLMTGIAGYSHNIVFFCLCRGFQGIGLAFILPSAIGIAGNLYPNGQRKALVFCFVAACAPTGATLGVVFGALTAQFGHWQWAYYSNAIVLALMGVCVVYCVPKIKPHHSSSKMDWLGAITGVTGLILFNFSFNQAPEVGWSSPYIIVLLIVGVLFLIAFFCIEKRVESPILPSEIMNTHLLLILSVIAFGWASFSIWTYYYWTFLLNLKNWTPLSGAASYGCLLFFGIVASLMVSVLIRKIRASYILFAAMCAFFIGITMLSTTPVHQTYFNMIFAQMVILSFGMDMSFPAASLVLSDTLPKRHQGMASSLVSTMINYSQSISLGFAGTAETKIFAKTHDLLKSYRAAMYVGVGLASISILLAIVLVICSYIWPHTIEGEQEEDHGESLELPEIQSYSLEKQRTNKKDIEDV